MSYCSISNFNEYPLILPTDDSNMTERLRSAIKFYEERYLKDLFTNLQRVTFNSIYDRTELDPLLVGALKYFVYFHFIQNERVFASVGGQVSGKLDTLEKLTNPTQLCEVYNAGVDAMEDFTDYLTENSIEWTGITFEYINSFGI
jgi:hypothetical protein